MALMAVVRAIVVVIFYVLLQVDDVSAQTSCVISPNIATLTIADGLARDVEFHCQCTDDNGMMITGTNWLLSNGNAAPTQNFTIPPAVLLIARSFGSTDAGTYICSPNNNQNDPSRDTITLSTGTPSGNTRSCNIYSPSLTTDGGVMSIPIGTQNVILYCICSRTNVAVGPARWLMGSTQVTPTTASGNNPYTRNSGSVPAPLIISSFTASHVGTYTCTSDGTVDIATIELAVLPVPTAPRSLMIVDVTDTTVILSWMPPDSPNGIITQYQVQYRIANSDDGFGDNEVNTTTTDLTYTVTGLTTNVEYDFRVRAFTVVGRGRPSNIVTAIFAPGPVSDVTVHNESVTSSTLTLTWMEISLTNSNFSHYTVFYLPVRDPYGPIMASNRRKRQSAQAGELTMNFTGTTGTLTNLYGAVTYRIQVATIVILNGQEITGDRSDAIEITTLEGVPTAPRNLNYTDLTGTGVTLTWSRPDPPNGLITQYDVSYSAINSQCEMFYFSILQVDNGGGIILSYTWTDLIQGRYQFSVVAFTRVGPGDVVSLMLSTLPTNEVSSDDSSDDNNGVNIALAALLAIAVIGLVISVVINVVQRKQSRYDVNQSNIRYSDVKQSVSRDKNNTDSTNKYIKPSEPEYEAIDTKPNVKRDCDVKMDVNPAYGCDVKMDVNPAYHATD